MSIGNVLVTVLGIADYIDDADKIITATEDVVDMVKDAHRIAKSDDVQAFIAKARDIGRLISEHPDGSVTIGSQPAGEVEYANGKYVLQWKDAIVGMQWVWIPKNGGEA